MVFCGDHNNHQIECWFRGCIVVIIREKGNRARSNKVEKSVELAKHHEFSASIPDLPGVVVSATNDNSS
jgi:hypothetical protein